MSKTKAVAVQDVSKYTSYTGATVTRLSTSKKSSGSTSSSKKTTSSSHLVITSIDVNYSKLIEEDQKKEMYVNERIRRNRSFFHNW